MRRPRVILGECLRKRTTSFLAAVLASVVFGSAGPGLLAAQLRPLEALDWISFDSNVGSAFLGVAGFQHQPASLLGSEGRLVELGLLGVSFRSGRIVLSFQGSVYRIFDAAKSFAEPLPMVEGQPFARRTDSGDYRLATAVRLTSGLGSWDAAFRFGVRLPTTDDRVGLERDQTDVFATVAGRYRRGPFALEAELGGAINGVAASRFDQTDPILYGVGVAFRSLGVEQSLRIAGQYDTRLNGPPRGNEHLSELSLGVRSLGRTWFNTEVVYGLAEFSPEWGLRLYVGRSF